MNINTFSLAQGFWFFSTAPKFFPPTYLTPLTSLLPTSPQFALIPLFELETRGQKKEGRTNSQNWEGRSGNKDNALKARDKSERAKLELEGKLPPFFSFYFLLFSCMVLL
jgi:hypothetical protein